jgi:hypothetical protein
MLDSRARRQPNIARGRLRSLALLSDNNSISRSVALWF